MKPRTIESLSHAQALHEKGELLGLFEMPSNVYHRGPGISSSGLKALLRSPAHYAAYLASPPDSDVLRKGRAIHSYVLERESFQKEFAVAPEVDRRTTGGKQTWEQFLGSLDGRTVITSFDFELCQKIWLSIQANDLARQALLSEGGMNETAVFWKDTETGVLCKAKADRILNDVIFDLKTTQDAQPREFQRSVALYGYHLSAAFYVDGFQTVLEKTPEFSWVAVEKADPHGIAFYAASPEALDIGRAEYAAALRAYQEFLKPRASGEPVPGYPQRIEMMSLPAWYAPKEAVNQ